MTSIIGESQYAIGSVEEWSKTIAESISTSIQKYEYPGYKYVINTMLIQKTDGGVQVIHFLHILKFYFSNFWIVFSS